MSVLLKDIEGHKKFAFEKAILPHVNAMIKEIKAVKQKDANPDADNTPESETAQA